MSKFITTYSTFDSFRPHFNSLERLAYFKIVLRNVSPIYKRLHYFYRGFIWFIVFIYNLQHLIRVVQMRHSTVDMINVLFILLTTLTTLGKQLSFNLKSERIDRIVDILDGPYFAPSTPYHELVVRRNGYVMQNLLRLYIASVVTCGTLWAIFPFVNRMLGKEVEFIAYFPFDNTQTPGFELSVAYLTIFITFQACGNVTMDCLIVSFFSQAKVQLQILRYNLEHLVDLEDGQANKTGHKLARPSVQLRLYEYRQDKDLLKVFQQRFVRCVLHYKKIKWFVKEIESIFAEVLTFQLLVMAWVICMTVYKLVNLDLLLAEILSMTMYLICMLAQFFIYCYYGTQLQYESECVNQSVYFSEWPRLPPAFRRQLLILTQNCSQPIIARTAYIVPISLKTYIMVLRSSYTLFTFLTRK